MGIFGSSQKSIERFVTSQKKQLEKSKSKKYSLMRVKNLYSNIDQELKKYSFEDEYMKDFQEQIKKRITLANIAIEQNFKNLKTLPKYDKKVAASKKIV